MTDIVMATEQIQHLLAAIDATAAMALREAGAVALRFLMKPCGEAPASVVAVRKGEIVVASTGLRLAAVGLLGDFA